MTINEGHEKRKNGYYMLTNKEITKVIAVSKNKDDLLEIKTQTQKIFVPLVKMIITKEDQEKYLKLHEIIWNNKKSNSLFGD